MKKQTVMQKNAISKSARNAFILGLLALGILIGMDADAQTIAKVNINSKDSAASEHVQVKYLGSMDDGVLFNVKYNNQTASPFTLIVSDASGEVLYEQTYTDKQFNKKFLLSRAYDKMSFVIRNDKEKTNQTFAINITSKVVEDVYVRRN
jgi:hypothetical protein